MIKIFTLLQIILISTQKQLVFIQQTFRHGARYPIQTTKIDYSDQAQKISSVGQLTSQGKHMHYTLGKILYNKYWQLLFNNTPYLNNYNQTQFYVKSTDVNRTIQSVQSQIFGLLQNLPPIKLNKQNQKYSLPAWNGYKEKFNQSPWNIYQSGPTFHPIPIHSQKQGANPLDSGDFLVSHKIENCPNQQFWIRQNYQNELTKQILQNKKVSEAIKALQQRINKTIQFKQLYKYLDNYVCEKYLNWRYLEVFEDETYASTFEFLQSFDMYQTLFSQDIQIKAIATNYMKKTLQNFEGKQNNTFTPRIVLYSAHDTTIGYILAAFNMTSVNCIIDHYLNGINNDDTCVWKFPTFSSNIIFQLWKDNNNQYTIQILYNGAKRKIPFCNYSYQCTLQEFRQWHDNFIVQNYFSTCGLVTSGNSYIGIVIFLTIVIIILLGYLVFLKFRKIGNTIKQNKDKNYEENFEEKEHQLDLK